jgi:acyl-CoA thioester hydrolase
MQHVSTSEFRVRYSETDQMGVVYHTNYLIWCEIGRTDFIRTSGSTYAELERRGVLLAVSEASIRYHAPARYDDLIRVQTRLAAVRSRAVTFDYVITNGETGDRLASARTALVCLDRAGRPVTMPEDFRQHLETFASMESPS